MENLPYPEKFVQMRRDIAKFVESNTRVIDYNSGYVVCEALNHAVDPTLLKKSAQIINAIFLSKLPPELQPTKIIGVPNRGRELAVALALETGLTIGVTERMEANGGKNEGFRSARDEDKDMVVINGVRSFTKPGKVFSHMIRAVHPGECVVVADDFSAYGHATDQYMEGLMTLGITPIFVYLAAKDFDFLDPPQTGYRRHKKVNNNIFAVVQLTGMIGGTGGRVIATAEDI